MYVLSKQVTKYCIYVVIDDLVPNNLERDDIP